MKVHPFFHVETGSLTYVVSDSGLAVIIDPVLDYKDGKILSTHIDEVLDFIKKKSLKLRYILDTHIHADHLSATDYVKKQMGGKTVMSKGIHHVFSYWKDKFGLEKLAKFDFLVGDNSRLHFGTKVIEVMETPGHTPACVTYRIDDCIFVGDTLFAPDRGTSRVDFPGGSAETLYQSIMKIYALPDNTNVYLCHDYPPIGISPTSCTPLEWQKKRNVMLNNQVSKDEYVMMRAGRDKVLNEPRLLNIAVPFNLTFKLPT
ncbi:MBL fold metallo-hydrolase [Enterovibrio calviensis]|uniref:MBL fold metallo-hydrolase n=1 Tax=Enterovibrio calviensis TaxID=91359 RepID=UPI00373610C2